MSRDLNEATPRMKEFALKLIGLAKEELGIKVIVTDVARPYEVQVALYAQGRETLENVNKDNKPDYIQLGALAKKIDKDIIWGGDWKKSKDYPHYEEPKWINPA